jgi:ribulose-phosphate 3-epimerase
LNPATPLSTLEEILTDVDLVLVMSVNPGFGGQAYIPGSTGRIRRLRQMLDEAGLDHVDLEVDGGLKAENVAAVTAAGANVLVIGSAIFNQEASVSENMEAIRRSLRIQAA